MKGSVHFRKDRGIWFVRWYCSLNKREYKIYRYKGEVMYDRKIAQKCLAMIQARWEQHLAGECRFDIEEFRDPNRWTDVLEYYRHWMKNVIEPNRKPATAKAYWSYYHNWIKPFFRRRPIMLHEIQLDTLTSLLNSINLSGKGKLNVMMALRSMLDYAWRSNRIPELPPFPKYQEYGIQKPAIKWLPEDRQVAIIRAIPSEHQPIFWWLKYHLRRPGEACALYKEDYDPFNGVFVVRRTISSRRIVCATKTSHEHIIPCHPDFRETANQLLRMNEDSPFMFVNPRARRRGKRYTNESLNILWKRAAESVGEDIDLYSGLKHSSCCQYVNERGLSLSELQVLTDHARLDSVRRYAKTEVARKLELMQRPKLSIVTSPRLAPTKNK